MLEFISGVGFLDFNYGEYDVYLNLNGWGRFLYIFNRLVLVWGFRWRLVEEYFWESGDKWRNKVMSGI